ncbi:chromate transporter [Capsulimonas corticalis]|uniref:chromate transporter n=1 Tax=Capsulimonas corticalis TaxID=2219043 RepID=UPI002603A358|nr:chromate transporter [Capsulimonas corticalis]
MPPSDSHLSNEHAKPSSGEILRVWLLLGAQSFGGGTATLSLIRREIVEERQWISPEEFARFWSLVQLAPGINLLALTILLGRKSGGALGIALALFGLLLPSVTITLILTMAFARVEHDRWMREALSGIVPAVVGLGLVTVWQIARPPLDQSRREGKDSFFLAILLIVGSVVAAWERRVPVVFILLGAAAVGAAWSWRRHGRRGEQP